ATRAAEFRATSVPVPFEDEARVELEWRKGETATVPPDVLVRIGDGRLVYAIRVAAAPGTGGDADRVDESSVADAHEHVRRDRRGLALPPLELHARLVLERHGHAGRAELRGARR